MDYLHSCYYSGMRLFRDRPDIIVPGRWHWSPPGAKSIPYFHLFGSFRMDPHLPRCNPPVGEVPRWRGKSRGNTNPRYLGLNWCGSKEVWEHGALYAQRGTPAVDAEGVPICCVSGPPIPGGAAAAGDSIFLATSTGRLIGGGEVQGGGPPAIGSRVGGGELLAGGQTAGGVLAGGAELLAGGVPGIGSRVGGGELLAGGQVAGGVLAGGSELLAGGVSAVESVAGGAELLAGGVPGIGGGRAGGGELLAGGVPGIGGGLAGGAEVVGGDLVAGGSPIGGAELLGGDLVAGGSPIGGAELLGGDLVAGGSPIGGAELLGGKVSAVDDGRVGGSELLAGDNLPTHGEALFTEPGDNYWICPPGVATFTVECWGAGEEGTAATIGVPGGGGGGGAYAYASVSGVPLMLFPLHVGNHAVAGGVADGTTTFGVGPLVSADCAGHRLPPGGQTPGLASLSIGAVKFDGGWGGLAVGGDGGGGGGSAGTASVGSYPSAAPNQPGATAVAGGGAGGDGATVAVGAPGGRPGGGGGGNIDPSAPNPQGADGQVRITW